MKQILEIDVTVDQSQCSELISTAGRVALLPLTGKYQDPFLMVKSYLVLLTARLPIHLAKTLWTLNI